MYDPIHNGKLLATVIHSKASYCCHTDTRLEASGNAIPSRQSRRAPALDISHKAVRFVYACIDREYECTLFGEMQSTCMTPEPHLHPHSLFKKCPPHPFLIPPSPTPSSTPLPTPFRLVQWPPLPPFAAGRWDHTLRRSLPARSTNTSLPYFFIGCPAVLKVLLEEVLLLSSGVVSKWRLMMQCPRDEYSFSLWDLCHKTEGQVRSPRLILAHKGGGGPEGVQGRVLPGCREWSRGSLEGEQGVVWSCVEGRRLGIALCLQTIRRHSSHMAKLPPPSCVWEVWFCPRRCDWTEV